MSQLSFSKPLTRHKMLSYFRSKQSKGDIFAFRDTFRSHVDTVADLAQKFRSRAKLEPLYEEIATSIASNDVCAYGVAHHWQMFSDMMPKVLATLATCCETNSVRHFLIQGAFEELGSGDLKRIHPELYRQCLENNGVGSFDLAIETKSVFNELKTISESPSTDHATLGVCLGLELYANENIKSVKSAVEKIGNGMDTVGECDFFRIHDVVEDSHIRLALENYLRFCITENHHRDFILHFDLAIEFWRTFWTSAIKHGAE